MFSWDLHTRERKPLHWLVLELSTIFFLISMLTKCQSDGSYKSLRFFQKKKKKIEKFRCFPLKRLKQNSWTFFSLISFSKITLWVKYSRGKKINQIYFFSKRINMHAGNNIDLWDVSKLVCPSRPQGYIFPKKLYSFPPFFQNYIFPSSTVQIGEKYIFSNLKFCPKERHT